MIGDGSSYRVGAFAEAGPPTKAFEATWLDAYVHAPHFKAHGVETLNTVFDVEFQHAAASPAGQ
jgi:hypothetical protein